MSFGHNTTLTLMVDACTTLPDVKLEEVTRRVNRDLGDKVEHEKRKAEEEEDEAFKELQKVVPAPPNTPQEIINKRKKLYIEAANKAEKARAKYEQLVLQDRQEMEKIRPNAFVTVTLDEDVQSGRPIAFTKTYRGVKRPFWHESFEDIPIGLLAHGKWGHQLLLSGTPRAYCPTRLNFWIYHDIGEDQESSEDSWKRDSPKRDFLIGRACLNFGSLVCNGCETWHELPVLDMFENPLPDCRLRVKTQMSTALPTHDSIIVQRPLNLPGRIFCGKAEEPCRCGNDCGGACMMGSAHVFAKPQKKHKCCKAKKPKCRTHCSHHHG